MRKLLVAGALALATFFSTDVFIRKSVMHDRSRSIRVALQGEFPVGALSPENISTIALYHLHYNLWDTLVAPGANPAVAKSFKVSTDYLSYSFEIDPDARFSNGRRITAWDVKEAFDRVIAREQNGHINARSVIREVFAESPVALRIRLSDPTPSFLFLLTTPEFGIVPAEALNSAGDVSNLTVTSGAYTAAEIDHKAQLIRLVRNRYFKRALPDSPEEVELSFVETLGADSLLRDYAFVEVRSSDSDKIVSSAEASGLSFKATVPSLSVYMVADDTLLSPAQAKFIAKAFRDHFQFETPRGLERRSSQFLPEKTFGSLSEGEIPNISGPTTRPQLPAEIAISNNRSTGPLVEAIERVFSQLGVKTRIVGLESKDPVHFVLTSQGMNTEYPEIELHLDTIGPYAFFHVSDEIKRYIEFATHEPDDSMRSAFIKKVGSEFLSSGKIIPLTVRSYVHLYDPSKVDLNHVTNYDGDIPFYRLKVPR